MIQLVTGLECDWYDGNTIDVAEGSWTPANRDMQPCTFPGGLVRYPNQVAGPTGLGWYRLYVFDDGTISLSQSARYTAEIVKGRLSRKLPIVLWRGRNGFLPWQKHGDDVMWTAFNHTYHDYMLENPGKEAVLPLVPEESRFVHLWLRATAPFSISTPGVASLVEFAAGTHTLSIVTNSQQALRFTRQGALSVGVRGYRMRGPI